MAAIMKNWTATCKKRRKKERNKEIRTYSLTIKINSECIKNLHLRPKDVKLLEDNIDSILFGSLSNVFLDLSPQARETTIKRNKWNLIKLKSFCPAKKTINK